MSRRYVVKTWTVRDRTFCLHADANGCGRWPCDQVTTCDYYTKPSYEDRMKVTVVAESAEEAIRVARAETGRSSGLVAKILPLERKHWWSR